MLIILRIKCRFPDYSLAPNANRSHYRYTNKENDMRNSLRRRLIRWLMRPLFNQGPWRKHNATMMFLEIREHWADEFTEDNRQTHDAHLTEMWHKSRSLL
jgi:hypothetical protein